MSDLYQNRMYGSSGQVRQEYAQKTLAEYERAYEHTPKPRSFVMLDNLARKAFEAGAFKKAKAYADQSLQSVSYQPEYARSSAIHYSNMVLGRLALHDGDVAEAGEFLLRSGQISGGPGLSTGGPNMRLARDLLQLGEKEAVLEYFTLCAGFWKMGAKRLKQWKKQVLNGQIPDFGRNLYY